MKIFLTYRFVRRIGFEFPFVLVLPLQRPRSMDKVTPGERRKARCVKALYVRWTVIGFFAHGGNPIHRITYHDNDNTGGQIMSRQDGLKEMLGPQKVSMHPEGKIG
eukprot:scaffold2850_cov175-Amphora_coffeaeformis.AAC.4